MALPTSVLPLESFNLKSEEVREFGYNLNCRYHYLKYRIFRFLRLIYQREQLPHTIYWSLHVTERTTAFPNCCKIIFLQKYLQAACDTDKGSGKCFRDIFFYVTNKSFSHSKVSTTLNSKNYYFRIPYEIYF